MDVKKIRTASGMSQQQFAGEIGVSVTTVSNWEVGKVKAIHPLIRHEIEKFAKRHKIGLDE